MKSTMRVGFGRYMTLAALEEGASLIREAAEAQEI